MLSERERRALARTERALRRQDAELVRAFDDLALHDRGPALSREARERYAPLEFGAPRDPLAWVASFLARLLLVLVAVGLVALIGFTLVRGGGQTGLLVLLVAGPLVPVIAVTVVALSVRST